MPWSSSPNFSASNFAPPKLQRKHNLLNSTSVFTFFKHAYLGAFMPIELGLLEWQLGCWLLNGEIHPRCGDIGDDIWPKSSEKVRTVPPLSHQKLCKHFTWFSMLYTVIGAASKSRKRRSGWRLTTSGRRIAFIHCTANRRSIILEKQISENADDNMKA